MKILTESRVNILLYGEVDEFAARGFRELIYNLMFYNFLSVDSMTMRMPSLPDPLPLMKNQRKECLS